MKARSSNLKKEKSKGNDAVLKQIAQKIKVLRKDHHVSQLEFYKLTNIHIGRIEAGKTNLTVNTICMICDFFNVSLQDFFSNIECD